MTTDLTAALAPTASAASHPRVATQVERVPTGAVAASTKAARAAAAASHHHTARLLGGARAASSVARA